MLPDGEEENEDITEVKKDKRNIKRKRTTNKNPSSTKNIYIDRTNSSDFSEWKKGLSFFF